MKARCELCDTDQDVRYEVTRYRLRDSFYWESGARCVDRAACRRRVEEKGQPWMVLDPEDLITHPSKASPLPDLNQRRGDALD